MDLTYPKLNSEHIAETRSGLHAFAKLLGAYTRACAPRRKHWWHISLRPVTNGFSTGALQNSGQLFELALNFHALNIDLRIAGEDVHEFAIQGESAQSLHDKLTRVLAQHSITIELDKGRVESSRYEIDREFASRLGQVYGQLVQCLARLRSGIPVETSPIQLWPHHFDLAMLVLTGKKIPGQDPENENYSDEQLNFGFVPGDEGIEEPYFFITFYAQAERLAKTSFPVEAYFHTEAWNGIVMPYELFRKNPQAETMLLNLWQSAWQAVQEEI